MAAVEIVLPTACSGHLPAYAEKPRETGRQSSGRGERAQHALPLLGTRYKWSPGNLRRQKASLNIDADPSVAAVSRGSNLFFANRGCARQWLAYPCLYSFAPSDGGLFYKITLPSPRDGNFNIAAGNNFNGGTSRQFHCESSEQFHRLPRQPISSGSVDRL